MTGRWRGLAAALVAFAAPMVIGCSSAGERIQKSIRTTRSWEATVRNTTSALSRGAVPRVYGKQLLQAAVDTERQLAKQMEWQAVPQNLRSDLAAAIRKLASTLGEASASAPRP